MSSLRVAVFHPGSSIRSPYCCSEGLVEILQQLGHEVHSFTNLGVTLEQLRSMDMILLSSLEWYAAKLIGSFGDAWQTIKAPKIAWYVESFERDDQNFDFEACRRIADWHYFPAIQDAQTYGGTWLPFGADTSIFKPSNTPKLYDAAFLGTLYPKRADYVGRINANIIRIQSVDDPDKRRSAELLAYACTTPKIFVNLPSLSRLMVTKVTEVMACGTFLLTPKIDHPAALKNMEPFVDRRHLVYYDPARPEEIGELIAHYLAHEDERNAIAASGLAEVREQHTFLQRVQRILSDYALRRNQPLRAA